MAKNRWFKDGDWNAVCDVCKFRYKASQLKRRWDGLMVCPEDFEYRHPQDFLRSIPDMKPVPWTRPRPPDVFIYSCTVAGRLGVAGYAVADCSICENVNQYPSIFADDPFALANDYFVNFNEVFTPTDALFTNLRFVTLSDSFTFGDNLIGTQPTFSVLFTEALGLAESIATAVTSSALSDNVQFSESISTAVNFHPTLTDSIPLAENIVTGP